MPIWKVWHYYRKHGAIGKYTIAYAIIKAVSPSKTREIHRKQLWTKGYETAGGTAEPIGPKTPDGPIIKQ